MRLVIQRVSSASVKVAERGVIGSIEKGLCVLVGIGHGDGEREIAWAVKHLLSTKFWPNDAGQQWKIDLMTSGYSILLVSQFTLYGKVYKKGKLDFHHALAPTESRSLYESLLSAISDAIGPDRTHAGEFGAMMEVIYNIYIFYSCSTLILIFHFLKKIPISPTLPLRIKN